MQVKNFSTTIAVPLARAYDFAHKPENFPKWAEGMTADAKIDYTPKNDFGILDHRVHVGDKVIYVPLRMIANGDGTEVVFTLFREPEMTDADFEKDQKMVVKDLANLKALLEK